MRTLFTLTNHIWPLKTIFNIWEIFINKKWNPKVMLGYENFDKKCEWKKIKKKNWKKEKGKGE